MRVIHAGSLVCCAAQRLAQGDMDFDVLLVKVTEGCTYVNLYCNREFQETLRLGKKLGGPFCFVLW